MLFHLFLLLYPHYWEDPLHSLIHIEYKLYQSQAVPLVKMFLVFAISLVAIQCE